MLTKFAKFIWAGAIMAMIAATASHAEGPAPKSGAPASMTAISPIFGQLVRFSMPAGFIVVSEHADGPSYIREATPKGESTGQWTQMITVTGHKGLAGNPKFTPQGFAGTMAGGFKGACPETFVTKSFGETKFGDQDAFVAVASCGKVSASADGHSETALIVVVRGSTDGYTIQWAERTASLPPGAVIDDAKWQARLHALMPIRFCPIVAGEAAPYPSCLQRK
jgi:hypothetical protein